MKVWLTGEDLFKLDVPCQILMDGGEDEYEKVYLNRSIDNKEKFYLYNDTEEITVPLTADIIAEYIGACEIDSRNYLRLVDSRLG